MTSYDFHNLRFTTAQMAGVGTTHLFVNVSRISDGHRLGQFEVAVEPSEADLAELALAWVLDRAGNTEPAKCFCARCDVELVPVFGDDGHQFIGALEVVLVGYYGGYIDLMPPEEPPRATLCQDCVTALADRETWFRSLVSDSYEYYQRGQRHLSLLLDTTTPDTTTPETPTPDVAGVASEEFHAQNRWADDGGIDWGLEED